MRVGWGLTENVPVGPGRTTRGLLKHCLSDAKSWTEQLRRSSSAVFAALAQNPSLIEPMRAVYSELHRRVADDGLPPGVGEAVITAIDGLWLYWVLGLVPVDQERMNRLHSALEEMLVRSQAEALAIQEKCPFGATLFVQSYEGSWSCRRQGNRKKMNHRGWIGSSVLLATVVALGVGLGAWKYSSLEESNAASARQPEPIESVTVAVASEREHRDTSTSIGTVLALRSVTLRNELAGTVQEVALTPGQIVEAGTVLVALDVSVEEAELKAQEAQAVPCRNGPPPHATFGSEPGHGGDGVGPCPRGIRGGAGADRPHESGDGAEDDSRTIPRAHRDGRLTPRPISARGHRVDNAAGRG